MPNTHGHDSMAFWTGKRVVVTGGADFLGSFFVLIGMMLVYRVGFSWRFLTLPVFLLFAATTALAMGLVALVGGAFYFRRTERTIVDVV